MAEEHSFTLIIEGDLDSKIDELFEAGCDDATFGSVDGVGYADFDREEPTFAEAVVEAIKDVESVGGLRVSRIEPEDLVTISDIATRFGQSRESIRLYISGERGLGGFPAPVSHLRTRNRLWRWSEVATWWDRTSGADAEEAIDAHLIGALNAVLELRATSSRLPEDTRELLSSLGPLGV